jgi:hypothetical protein
MSDTVAKPNRKAAKAAAKAGAQGDAGTTFSIASHARAKRSVREIKSWVGLIGFGLALVLSLDASVPLAIAAERALIAGVAGYLVAWACAVAVWRALLAAELHARVDEVKARREQSAAAASVPGRR